LQVEIHQLQRSGQAVLASLFVGLILWLNALVACPGLHEWFHSDAKATGHQCAVTLLAQGQVDSPAAAVALVVPLAPIDLLPPVSTSVVSPLVNVLPPGRGPPFSLHNS